MVRFARSWSGEELLNKASSALSKAAISIETDKDTYSAGETVKAKVRIDFPKACSVEEGSIALTWAWGYEYTMDQTTHYTESSEAWVEQPILAGRSFQAGESVLEEFSGEIPVNSQPTGRGVDVQVRWEVYVHLKMQGIDGRESRPIEVLSSTVDLSGPHPQSAKVTGEDYDLQINIEQPWVRPGDPIDGTVTVLPHKDLNARWITARLEYREKISSGSYWQWKPSSGLDMILADQPGTLPDMAPKSYPFRFLVPPEACPSLETVHFSTRWVLEGKVERRLRRDLKVELPVQVRTAPRMPDS